MFIIIYSIGEHRNKKLAENAAAAVAVEALKLKEEEEQKAALELAKNAPPVEEPVRFCNSGHMLDLNLPLQL